MKKIIIISGVLLSLFGLSLLVNITHTRPIKINASENASENASSKISTISKFSTMINNNINVNCFSSELQNIYGIITDYNVIANNTISSNSNGNGNVNVNINRNVNANNNVYNHNILITYKLFDYCKYMCKMQITHKGRGSEYIKKYIQNLYDIGGIIYLECNSTLCYHGKMECITNSIKDEL